jgi:hypothetical protein
MIDLGVATSILKDNQYSWKDTIDFALSLNLNSIQFYLPKNKIIPRISEINKFKNLYLHLPNDFDSKLDESISYSSSFQKSYRSDKIIFHQNKSISNEKTLILIKKFNDKGLVVGLENDGGQELYSYCDLIEYLSLNKVKLFSVLDIHRFYFNYYKQYGIDDVHDMIEKLLSLCSESDLGIVLHVVDSKSFNSDRKMWVPLLTGRVPYSEIFNFLSKKEINVDSMIFEFESKAQVLSSIKNFRKYSSGL